ncbi:MAG TPA: glycoside hydrolase family 3 N-terminal domain-containing protein, partial [Naasia sp.]
MGNRRDVRAALDREAHISIALGDLAAGGLPPLVWTDAGNGIRDAAGATAFPSSLALAASFDTDLARRHGEALGREAKAAGRNAVLGPALDIARVPVAGRTGESFGEDPLLTGELGGSVAAGIQSQAVLAVVKHYLANNFEHGRTGSGSFARRTHAVDVRIGAGTLRELYAEPFRRALVDYGAGGLMGSYNRLGGRYVCENPALLRIPRAEWGWQGVIVPDFLFAVRD